MLVIATPAPLMREAIIIGDNVALRKTASSNGGIITRLDEGTVVKFLASNVNAEWYQVEAGTKTGYVNRLYVNIDASLPSYQMDYTGTIFNVLDIAGAWAWGQVGEDGLVGYVALDQLGDA